MNRANPLLPALFVLLWSTGFIAAKYGLPYAPPLKFLLVRFALVTALMTIVTLVTRARVAGARAADRAHRRRRVARAWRAISAACSSSIAGGHAGWHERDAGRPAADPHRVPRPRLARRADHTAAMARPGARTRRRLPCRPAQDRARRRLDGARRHPRGARRHQRRHAVPEEVLRAASTCAAAPSIQFAACALLYAPIVALARAAADRLDGAVPVRARLVGDRALGRRDQPAVLAAAARRRGRRRASLLPRAAGHRADGVRAVRRAARCAGARRHGVDRDRRGAGTAPRAA